MEAIQASNLSKVYKNGRGIHGIDLSVAVGDIYGFIGPNGAGKSTFIRTLLGFMQSTGGEGYVLGQRIGAGAADNLRRVGYLPSEAIFYKGMKVGEVLAYAAKLRGLDCRKKARELAGLLDMDLGQKVDTLSLGNRKKVSIVAALQHEPDLYLLDEPTSGLDPLVQRTFWHYMGEVNARGATVFVSSHILSEVQRHCRNVGVIRDGRLIVSAPVEHFTKTQTRRVTVDGEAEVDSLPGALDVQRHNGHITFVYQGEMQPLLKALYTGSVRDMTITELDLEEVFGQYYGGQP